LQAYKQQFYGAAMKKNTTSKKQNRAALRKRRATRRFAFLKQLRRDTKLSSSAKIAVWSLADDSYNLDNENCNPGFSKIGTNIGRTGRQAKRSIREAQDAGWIMFTSTLGGSETCTNRYSPVWDKVANTTQDAHSATATPDATPNDPIEDGEYTEIIEEHETEGGHTCPPSPPEDVPEGVINGREGGHTCPTNLT
jgi:hypothetical protein